MVGETPLVFKDATPSVATSPKRMLTDVSMSFDQIDHLQSTLAAIQSRRYNNVARKPWEDEDGNQVWGECRILVAKVVLSQLFETCMGLVIVFNLCIIIYEADMDAQCYPDFAGEKYPQCPYRAEALGWINEANIMLLVIYSIECAIRAFVERNRFCCNPWNVTDLLIVVLGWSSMALSTVNLSLLRLSRLVRVLRAARVFISVPEFYLLLTGLFSSMKAIVFGSIILVSVIGFWAVVAVELFHPTVADLPFGSCERCSKGFQSVASAGVTLFQQIVAGDSWGEISIPLLYAAPWTAPILFTIMVSVSLGVMNLILAVIVERATEARENDHERKLKKKDIERNRTMLNFAKICHDMDADGSGSLSLNEMQNGYDGNDDFRKLMDIMDIKRADMETIFRVLDEDCSGEVSYIEFCQHLASFWERDPVMLQSLLKYSIMEIRKVIGDEIVSALKEHEKILREQNRLLCQHFGTEIPDSKGYTKASHPSEWMPPDLHSFASLQDELQPLLAKASMLVMEALPAEIATAFAEDELTLPRPSDPRAEKVARWKEWAKTCEGTQPSGPSDVPGEALVEKIEEHFTSLCEAFEHRIREADSFQQRCRSLMDYLKVLKTETVNGKISCCIEVPI